MTQTEAPSLCPPVRAGQEALDDSGQHNQTKTAIRGGFFVHGNGVTKGRN